MHALSAAHAFDIFTVVRYLDHPAYIRRYDIVTVALLVDAVRSLTKCMHELYGCLFILSPVHKCDRYTLVRYLYYSPYCQTVHISERYESTVGLLVDVVASLMKGMLK
jgi:hypothetical protein